ncbi:MULTISPECIES: antitoxin Xre/MbcA/ParS toxin-binding domain-containing protein [unclassified Novosphingobium]|uniref:antitoxin Xre/MbcA/ParS toxin-binding domain-containing protein n=1 Tax=unclassified Novosphingobium TaxID=2644732 RepID=UPI00020EFB82|nr:MULTISPECIES: antitoxin Xre/MbcA/ParS toxin-binding domain-containing protein [unclassified Novosphingobium]GFM30672.1 uncharacterized protein PY1_contig-12-33 [Novosphingobium sp. PY1]CCA90722.1 conserved hypothetical protein [Novosphingobium sp. PP1Y]
MTRHSPFPDDSLPVIENAIALLGGKQVLGLGSNVPLDLHERLVAGLPLTAVEHLIASVPFLAAHERFHKVSGLRLATYRRHLTMGKETLSSEQSQRIWRFAVAMCQAAATLGDLEVAADWMTAQILPLAWETPLDFMGTEIGGMLVLRVLGQIEAGSF